LSIPFFTARLAAFADDWANMNFLFRVVQTWGNHLTNYIVVTVGAFTALYLMATRDARDSTTASLTMTYSLLLPYFVTTASHHFTQLRTALASLERLLEYLQLPQERARTLPTDPESATWPTLGRIEFRQLCVRYRPELPPAVDGLSALIQGGQKAGICGRTGSGKSSLILALFRLVEPSEGSILVDGVDVATLGLERMRSAITIIPQDPTLHKGSVAHNLDPFGKHTAEELRGALRRTGLDEKLLATEVEKAGANLSSGERQLLCFARALLGESKILVLDEATSNLDAASDTAIQALLRDEFASRTILTIAHRLNTIIDYHTILVLSRGKLLEQGAPLDLLEREDGALASMVKALGESGEAALRQKARESAGK